MTNEIENQCTRALNIVREWVCLNDEQINTLPQEIKDIKEGAKFSAFSLKTDLMPPDATFTMLEAFIECAYNIELSKGKKL